MNLNIDQQKALQKICREGMEGIVASRPWGVKVALWDLIWTVVDPQPKVSNSDLAESILITLLGNEVATYVLSLMEGADKYPVPQDDF